MDVSNYSNESIRSFVRKHPRNVNNLFHMLLSSHMSLVNLMVSSPQIAISALNTNAVDIAKAVCNARECSTKECSTDTCQNITTLLTEHAVILSELRQAILDKQNLNSIIARANQNNIALMNAFICKPILVSKGITLWTEYISLYIKRIRDPENTQLYTSLQLSSFPIANFIVKATA